jgi:hypothetical protein
VITDEAQMDAKFNSKFKLQACFPYLSHFGGVYHKGTKNSQKEQTAFFSEN